MTVNDRIQSFVDRYFLSPSSRVAVASLQRIIAGWELVLATVMAMMAAAYVLYLLLVTHNLFWDFNGYIAAVKAMGTGASPYDRTFIASNFGAQIPQFPYPPLVAEAFYQLSGLFLTPGGLVILLIATIVSVLGIPYLLADFPRRWYSPKFLYMCGLYLVLFGFGGMRLVANGNIQPIVCAAIIVSIIAAVYRHDYKLFWIALAFCSFIKFYFLAFILFPLILDKKYAGSIAFVLLFGALYAANYVFYPELFSQFLTLIGNTSRD